MLHYSTLATALWVGVTARNIYKQVTRKAKRYEELDEPPPPPRPMLRYNTSLEHLTLRCYMLVMCRHFYVHQVCLNVVLKHYQGDEY